MKAVVGAAVTAAVVLAAAARAEVGPWRRRSSQPVGREAVAEADRAAVVRAAAVRVAVALAAVAGAVVVTMAVAASSQSWSGWERWR